MLLSIFIFLVLFSLVLIVAGYYIEAPVAQIAGTAIMFITGLLLLIGTIQYSAGSTQNISYSYEDGNLSSSFVNETTTLQSWDEEIVQGIKTRHTVAFLLLITAILVFISVLSQLREGIDDER